MIRFALILLLILPSIPGQAQRSNQRKRPDIIPLEGQAKRGGFYFAPGATFALPRSKDREEVLISGTDSSFSVVFDPHGRPGLYLEAGYFFATRDPVILDYWDIGLAYKNLRGSQTDTYTLVRNDTTTVFTGLNTFAEQFITLHVNANKFIQTGNYQFIQLSLGANADYRLGSAYGYSVAPLLGLGSFPPNLITQLHVKVGYGFKVTGNLLVIPALETPVFSITPKDIGAGQLQWFNSRYRPLILSVRFLFLRARDGFKCPPPIKHNAKEKTYRQDGYHN
ncbi:MAG: hypothetical protein IPO87_06100 [Flavobacteriales bacterium]|nr:hypothetical protein [Flavobacteriales bacterium]